MFTSRDRRAADAGAGRPRCRVVLAGLASAALALAVAGPAAADPPGGDGGESVDLAVRSVIVAPNPVTDMVVDYQTPAGTLSTLAPTGSTTTRNASLAAGTSPSVFPETPVGFDHVFTGSNGKLWRAVRSGGAVDTGLTVAAGTSPQLVLDRLGVEVLFQGGNGHLWKLSPTGSVSDTGLTMPAASSPVITIGRFGAVNLALQGTNGHLFIVTPSGNADTTLTMRAGTSPSAVPLSPGIS